MPITNGTVSGGHTNLYLNFHGQGGYFVVAGVTAPASHALDAYP